MPRRLLRPNSPGGRPRVIYSEPDDAFRMAAINALRDRFELITIASGLDPVRKAREEGPEMVLISVAGNPERALRACRLLKAELDPPTVGVLNLQWARLTSGEVMEGSGADGYLLGRPDLGVFDEWVVGVYSGERPIITLPRPGILGRIKRRLKR